MLDKIQLIKADFTCQKLCICEIFPSPHAHIYLHIFYFLLRKNKKKQKFVEACSMTIIILGNGLGDLNSNPKTKLSTFYFNVLFV